MYKVFKNVLKFGCFTESYWDSLTDAPVKYLINVLIIKMKVKNPDVSVANFVADMSFSFSNTI